MSNSTSPRTRRSAFTRAILASSLGLGAVATPLVASASAAGAAPCPTGKWSATAQGRPAFSAGSSKGMYLWHDASGWHLRVTHRGSGKVVFTGTVDSSDEIGAVTRSLEGKDKVVITPGKGRVHFRVENYGGIDGIDFKVACAKKFTFNGHIDSAPVSSANVYLGSTSAHPTSVPFTMERS